jgi:hypothetical protein
MITQAAKCYFDFRDYEENYLLEFVGVWTGGIVPMFQSGLLLPSSWYLMNDDAGTKMRF